MILFGRNPERLFFGELGILPADIPTGLGAEFESPLLDDLDPGDTNTQLLWLILNLPDFGLLNVLDDGTFQHITPGRADTIGYRLFATPETGAPVVSESTITTGNPLSQEVAVEVFDRVVDVVREAVSVGVAAVPQIVTQPQGQTAAEGAVATFVVGAIGSAPLSYQWRFTPVGGAPVNVGTNSLSYSRTTALADNGGVVSVVVSNGVGSVTSAVATLTVEAVVVAPTVIPGRRKTRRNVQPVRRVLY